MRKKSDEKYHKKKKLNPDLIGILLTLAIFLILGILYFLII